MLRTGRLGRTAVDEAIVSAIEATEKNGGEVRIPIRDGEHYHNVRARYYSNIRLRSGKRMRSKSHGDVLMAWIEKPRRKK